MSAIVDIVGREILDSRGNPTVECDVLLESRHDGPRGRAVGRLHRLARSHRAARRRQERATAARACCKAVEHINTEISEAVLGLDASEQAFLDQTLIDLDGTDNKARLGANATLAVSHGGGARRGRGERACRCTATSAAWARCRCRCR